MKAAVIRSYERGPEYEDFEEPIARSEEILVAVKAAALSRLVQAQASGKHYSSDGSFPFVPGGDGVGVCRTANEFTSPFRLRRLDRWRRGRRCRLRSVCRCLMIWMMSPRQQRRIQECPPAPLWWKERSL
jgi:D-arabinose 1-dehydrogenase-like Zn-dependent alcohol dehydrogenase